MPISLVNDLGFFKHDSYANPLTFTVPDTVTAGTQLILLTMRVFPVLPDIEDAQVTDTAGNLWIRDHFEDIIPGDPPRAHGVDVWRSHIASDLEAGVDSITLPKATIVHALNYQGIHATHPVSVSAGYQGRTGTFPAGIFDQVVRTEDNHAFLALAMLAYRAVDGDPEEEFESYSENVGIRPWDTQVERQYPDATPTGMDRRSTLWTFQRNFLQVDAGRPNYDSICGQLNQGQQSFTTVVIHYVPADDELALDSSRRVRWVQALGTAADIPAGNPVLTTVTEVAKGHRIVVAAGGADGDPPGVSIEDSTGNISWRTAYWDMVNNLGPEIPDPDHKLTAIFVGKVLETVPIGSTITVHGLSLMIANVFEGLAEDNGFLIGPGAGGDFHYKLEGHLPFQTVGEISFASRIDPITGHVHIRGRRALLVGVVFAKTTYPDTYDFVYDPYWDRIDNSAAKSIVGTRSSTPMERWDLRFGYWIYTAAPQTPDNLYVSPVRFSGRYHVTTGFGTPTELWQAFVGVLHADDAAFDHPIRLRDHTKRQHIYLTNGDGNIVVQRYDDTDALGDIVTIDASTECNAPSFWLVNGVLEGCYIRDGAMKFARSHDHGSTWDVYDIPGEYENQFTVTHRGERKVTVGFRGDTWYVRVGVQDRTTPARLYNWSDEQAIPLEGGTPNGQGHLSVEDDLALRLTWIDEDGGVHITSCYALSLAAVGDWI